MSHDYCHCDNQDCPKAETCFRAWLSREDARIKKEHPDTVMWCSHFVEMKPDENGECENYINRKGWC